MNELSNIATPLDTEAALADIAEQMADELRQRGTVDVAAWQSQYPEIASEIQRLLPTLAALANFSATSDPAFAVEEDPLPDKTLGDFQIIRELGRGGMGIVYEAEQLSLNRRVALKILPLAAVLDPRTLQRFKNEAQAAAALDHPHIVDVYGVGSERGIHYYAMRLIDGCTLADLIFERRARSKLTNNREREASAEPPIPNPKSKIPNLKPAADTASLALLSTEPTRSHWPFFRAVAELGRHVADGLSHAHDQGVVHRDIKPSNLMLDGQGKVWITDFGLAQIEAGQNLTQTGDLLGTLRYMSPEQTLANRAPIDQRSDIYSLGATLYELLTLQPVFADSDRTTLLQKIALTEPPPPRQLNPQIPADLETIILKMLEKDPGARYFSAAELAADLQRFVENKPITARRPTLSQRLTKWSVRNRALVTISAAVVVLIAAITGGLLGWWSRDSAARQAIAERIAGEAFAAAEQFRQDGDWPLARRELERAEAALTPLAGQTELSATVKAAKRDAQFVLKLDDVRLLSTMLAGGDFDFRSADQSYTAAFADYGLLVTTLTAAETVRQVRDSPIRIELASALTDWGLVRQRLAEPQQPNWQHFLNIARQIDPDPRRNLLRKEWRKSELIEMAESPSFEKQPPSTLFLFVTAVTFQQANDEAMQIKLRNLQRQHANDFWLNFALAQYFEHTAPPRWDEAVRYYSVALGLRPEAAAVHNNLGAALHKSGRRAEAIAEYRRASELSPKTYFIYANLAVALAEQGQPDEAKIHLHKALELGRDNAALHEMLKKAKTKNDAFAELVREL